MLEHDLIVWVGDLNYRIATLAAALAAANAGGPTGPAAAAAALRLPADAAAVRAAIRSGGRMEELLSADQLSRERAAGRVFQVRLGGTCRASSPLAWACSAPMLMTW